MRLTVVDLGPRNSGVRRRRLKQEIAKNAATDTITEEVTTLAAVQEALARL